MKKIKQLFVFSLLIIGFAACNKDDDKKSLTEQNKEKLIGNWKFTSSFTNGIQDDNGACELMEIVSITANQISFKEFWGENCAQTETSTINYSLTDNTISITTDGETFLSEIVKLTATELSIKSVYQSEVYVENYIKQ